MFASGPIEEPQGQEQLGIWLIVAIAVSVYISLFVIAAKARHTEGLIPFLFLLSFLLILLILIFYFPVIHLWLEGEMLFDAWRVESGLDSLIASPTWMIKPSLAFLITFLIWGPIIFLGGKKKKKARKGATG